MMIVRNGLEDFRHRKVEQMGYATEMERRTSDESIERDVMMSVRVKG